MNEKTEAGFVQCFHYSSKNKIYMHTQTKKYKLLNFSGSAYELNTHICIKNWHAKCKDE